MDEDCDCYRTRGLQALMVTILHWLLVRRGHVCPSTGHEIYDFDRSFFDHHYNILILPKLCLRVEKIFKETYQFHTLYPNITVSIIGVGGHEIYNFLSPFYTGATFQIGKVWQVVLEKKMLMMRNTAQRTVTNKEP